MLCPGWRAYGRCGATAGGKSVVQEHVYHHIHSYLSSGTGKPVGRVCEGRVTDNVNIATYTCIFLHIYIYIRRLCCVCTWCWPPCPFLHSSASYGAERVYLYIHSSLPSDTAKSGTAGKVC